MFRCTLTQKELWLSNSEWVARLMEMVQHSHENMSDPNATSDEEEEHVIRIAID